MLVVLLLALIWAGVLVPPAVMAHRERQEAFMLSMGQLPGGEGLRPRPSPRAERVRRRRRIAGGLLAATVSTLVIGLLPTFRVFLVVHLFLLDSLIGYLAGLAHMANRAARARAVVLEPVVVEEAPRPSRRWWPRPVVAPAPAGLSG